MNQRRATHPAAGMALALAAAQIEAARVARPGWVPTLGLLYLTEACAPHAAALLDEAARRWPGVCWAGASAWGLAADGVEYLDEPALVLWLADLPPDQFRAFDGRRPLADGWAGSALVHADPDTPELPALLQELAERTRSGYLFGGLPSARVHRRHWADSAPLAGGLSGVAFAPSVGLLSRVSQGCQPVGPTRVVTGAERHVVTGLDGEPALPQLLGDLGVSLDQPQAAMAALRRTLVGLTDRKSTRLNSSHSQQSRMPSSA